MTLYAPTDVQSIHLPDGCGEGHGIEGGAQLIIECGPCEAAMTAHKHLGWAVAPENVAPTCDERLQAERDEVSAQKAGIARLNAFANGGDSSANGALAALVEQNTALMAQLTAVTAQLAAAQAPVATGTSVGTVFKLTDPTPGTATTNTGYTLTVGPADKPADLPGTPVKRAPGRPRKNPEA